MDDVAALRQFLRGAQNPDGGWGYFAGKQSWLEPTAYAALAMIGDAQGAMAVERAWALLRVWQNPDGGFRPNASVTTSTWGTALAVMLGDALGDMDGVVDRAARWLVATSGAENWWFHRILCSLGIARMGRNARYRGWPWRPETSAWVEPTVHSLVALRRLARKRPDSRLAARIDSGERMLLSVRCTDGGWNYGSPRALGVELPSYPETTALALVGLEASAPRNAVELARRHALSAQTSPLALAWLRVALRLAGDRPFSMPVRTGDNDVVVAAVDCIGAEVGNWRLFGAG